MKIDDSLYLANKPEKDRGPNDVLGKDDFLKLLITQLKYQDPMEPMKDKAFISQMASFTTLEQTKNMSDMLERFVKTQSTNVLSSQAEMIGKEVTWQTAVTNENGEPSIEEKTGIVMAVTLKDSAVKYVTETGDTIDPSQLVSVCKAKPRC
ncbi:flagellar basal-body rod modification protein FlgD [Scopulibacillus darangshiensis]|uniref:Flagellar basal-body rod modification protein FlgD n=1 Tax=Scopulibacillus darangshiensis TaxID=442528 RepID=A0A4R2P8Z4_9BACL|nr:flagellar hook assembly protein FlgD [Scopulibacillus darangshiensis]TCP30325.1 flagellar basal-body rod modification protein FlgD [Scopulibacillus darangshiensis]